MSGVSPAAGLKSGQFNQKRNFTDPYKLLLIVGAVFACIPLLFSGATAINSVWHIHINVVSYEVSSR
jgi:hypothetical protein